ncbi:MAG TPA: Gfo/Idh/MocA family oxidoreductase [Desulfobulbaceae bacterium]|nr:Gfo/Idh/MocA family oxidoreductase [Desulfobulbaceae bacterium]HHD62771.1 Gfo/Idh/MocA family oxidoreductase [Desulfobulbaceae bacterium]
MKIGIIGTGKHGSRYARHIIRDVEGLELSAISRRSAKRLAQAEEWRCRAYEDWRALVGDERVEAVISVVPPALNLAVARACADASKPLLLEKPLAAGLADAREIAALARAGELLLTVGQTLRYNPVIRCFKKHLPDLGPLYTVSVNQRIEPSTLSWHEDPALAGAGVSYHTAVHIFDALRFITGLEIVRVMAMATRRHNRVLEDSLLALIEMEKGVQGVVDCSKIGQARSGRFDFVCRQGQLTGDQIYTTCESVHHTTRTDLKPGPAAGTIIPLLEDWREYLAGAGPNPITGVDGLQAVAVCDACLRSARRKAWVDVESK